MSRRWKILAGLVALSVAWDVYNGRPRPSVSDDALEYSRRLASDPATASAETELHDALRTLVDLAPASDAILQAQQYWLEGRVDTSGWHDPDPAFTSTAGRIAALRQQILSWQAAMRRRPTLAELGEACVYQVDYAPCRVTQAAEVPGSGGSLRYQLAARFLADTDDAGPNRNATDRDAAYRAFQQKALAARNDPMVGSTIDVFAPDPAGGWRMVLSMSGRADETPSQMASPAGPLLVSKRDPQYGPALYAMIDGRWRYLYQGSWRIALAERGPVGTCLSTGFYLGTWPWPMHLLPSLSRMPPDIGTLTYDAAFDADGKPVATVHAVLGIQGQELVLRSSEVHQTAQASILDKLFNRCRS